MSEQSPTQQKIGYYGDEVFQAVDCTGTENQQKYQGWARDVQARDRDETESLTSRDETESLASPAETRTRRDICSSRDEIETLNYKFY